ncbi:MAG: hypothetical protein JNM18_21995 [Planctomycetaceae bacterium]|nr:hypothetical protein [Planctomycetaceae bacterium]
MPTRTWAWHTMVPSDITPLSEPSIESKSNRDPLVTHALPAGRVAFCGQNRGISPLLSRANVVRLGI